MTHETILIVDDDEITRRLLHGILAPSYRVLSAQSGAEALTVIRRGPLPDLIISDLMMPLMSGYELCSLLKADPVTRDIPIVFVTALSQPKQEEEGLRLGAVDYIGKPVRPELLKARIKNHLELKAYREDLKGLVEVRTRELVDSQTANRAMAIELRYFFETMGEVLASRDHYTSEHALRVAEISVRIGRVLGLDAKELEILELGCLVHDIGKVAIPDDVLLKPGRFDKQDRQIMECHPLIGARLFSRRFEDDRIALIILQHHERLDGSGYPAGVKDDDINDLAKIVMVADVYEALVARRPYKKPMTRGQALAILYDDAGRGKVREAIVRALEQITVAWDPLEIHIDLTADYMTRLELFRCKTYFREPLSDFYNYRYLSTLDRAGSLCRSTAQYQIMKADFNALKELNFRVGYAKADLILDEIGHTFHDLIEGALADHSLPTTALMLLRRGSDYLIYSECDPVILQQIANACRLVLADAERQWGLKTSVSTTSFAKGKAVDDALEEIYGHQHCEVAAVPGSAESWSIGPPPGDGRSGVS
jgi:putative nucleotidyltransferase with HDIG domain